MGDDFLISRLEALCRQFAATALDGRYAVAKKANLSEQYLYQIITRKPMANGGRRSIGKVAREKLTKAFPGWLDQPNEMPPALAQYTSPRRHSRPLVEAVCTLAEQIDDNGLRELIGFARCLTRTHPLSAKSETGFQPTQAARRTKGKTA